MIGLDNMSVPLISVIIPVYNVETQLRKCADSILAQTYPNIEMILVDDGSTDRSTSICDSYDADARVKVIHQSNGGLSSARNAGIDASSGDYIGFVDSDDFIAPDMYESLYRMIRDKERAIGCIGISAIDENNTITEYSSRKEEEIQDKTEYLRELLLFIGDASACSKLFPRSFFFGNKFREGRLNEDVLFMFESAESYDEIVYTPKNGYYYFSRSGSITRSFGKSIHDMVTNAREIREIVDRCYPELSPYAERYEIYQNMAFLRHCPSTYDRKSDPMCAQVLHFVRSNLSAGWRSHYLSIKEKMILTALCIAPRAVSFILERKK